jgi:hypothetical protein
MVHYATINEVLFSLCCAKLCYAKPSHTASVAMQRCDKHISTAANQHATVKNAVFRVSGAYITQQWLGVT